MDLSKMIVFCAQDISSGSLIPHFLMKKNKSILFPLFL